MEPAAPQHPTTPATTADTPTAESAMCLHWEKRVPSAWA